jgi:hypothetical protein
MAGSSRVKLRRPLSGSAVLAIVGILVLTAGAGRLSAQARDGSPGPLADSCGVPPASASAAGGGGAGGRSGTPVFPAGQYPVKLPSASLLGARNDLPNPYRAGVSWGQLPEGRRWGSTASVTREAMPPWTKVALRIRLERSSRSQPQLGASPGRERECASAAA